MSLDLTEFLNVVTEDEFEETPVDIDTFVSNPEYLGQTIILSDVQKKLVEASTQIFKKDTLVRLHGEEGGRKIFQRTFNEVIFQLGKGGGKDFTSGVACVYLIYLLLCLRDPSRYYGKMSGDAIDIINVAVNAEQARNVFFKNVKRIIEKSPWFAGKYTIRQSDIAFDKAITLYSGHSERESWEGYNFFMVVLDEISGFQMESKNSTAMSKTSQGIYDMYRASVDSRFPDFGKVVMLSFPRYKNDFIQQRYKAVVDRVDIIPRTHTFVINSELPPNTPGNEFDIHWEEDHIRSYKIPRVFAMKRTSWDSNPTREIDDYLLAFINNPVDALSRFACMPPDAVDALFKSREKIEAAFSQPNGIDEETGRFKEFFQPDETKKYYIHVDLAKKHDYAALAMSHVDRWVQHRLDSGLTERLPLVVVDVVKYWEASPSKDIDFSEVRDFITSLSSRGFDISLVTFDRWRSDDLINYLNSIGIRSEVLSVAKRHYVDLAMTLNDERIIGPVVDILITELLELRITDQDKVDHPRTGTKDLSDAVCGSHFNAISRTKPEAAGVEIEVITQDKLIQKQRERIVKEQADRNVIVPPPKAKDMPPELKEYMDSINLQLV